MSNNAKILEPLLIDVGDVCEMLSISRASYFAMKATGRFGPSEIKFGRKILLRRLEVEKWVAQGCPPRRLWVWK